MHQTPVEPSGSQFADPFNFLIMGQSYIVRLQLIDCIMNFFHHYKANFCYALAI